MSDNELAKEISKIFFEATSPFLAYFLTSFEVVEKYRQSYEYVNYLYISTYLLFIVLALLLEIRHKTDISRKLIVVPLFLVIICLINVEISLTGAGDDFWRFLNDYIKFVIIALAIEAFVVYYHDKIILNIGEWWTKKQN